MNGTRVDTSHIRSPHDPMTPAEREAVKQELRDEAAWVDACIARYGDPWSGLKPDWAQFADDAA